MNNESSNFPNRLGPQVWLQGEGEILALPNLPTVLTVTSQHTGGSYSVVEQVIRPRLLFPPHVHQNEDQFAYILEGVLWFRVGATDVELHAGECIFRPRQLPHATWNATDQSARMLEITSPGAFDDYFRELATPRCVPGELAAQWGISPVAGADEITDAFGLVAE